MTSELIQLQAPWLEYRSVWAFDFDKRSWFALSSGTQSILPDKTCIPLGDGDVHVHMVTSVLGSRSSSLMRISCVRTTANLEQLCAFPLAPPSYQWYSFHAARVFACPFWCIFLCNKRGYIPCPNLAFYSSTSGVKIYQGPGSLHKPPVGSRKEAFFAALAC